MTFALEPELTLPAAQAAVETRKYPRVTKQSIEAKIANVSYYQHGTLMIAILTMDNGFFVTGQAAPADPRNFLPEVGERYAYEDAFKKLWQFEGHLLRQRIHEGMSDAMLAKLYPTPPPEVKP